MTVKLLARPPMEVLTSKGFMFLCFLLVKRARLCMCVCVCVCVCVLDVYILSHVDLWFGLQQYPGKIYIYKINI